MIKTPSDLDKAYVEKRGAQASRGCDAGLRSSSYFSPKTEADRKRDALKSQPLVHCIVKGCRVPTSPRNLKCVAHQRAKIARRAMGELEPMRPGLCNKPVTARSGNGKRGGRRLYAGMRCKIPADRCPYHKGIPDPLPL